MRRTIANLNTFLCVPVIVKVTYELVFCLLVVCSLVIFSHAASAERVELITYTGATIPAGSTSGNLRNLLDYSGQMLAPMISDQGEVLFSAAVDGVPYFQSSTGSPIYIPNAIVRWDGSGQPRAAVYGGLAAVSRSGTPSPYSFSHLVLHQVLPSGEVSFFANINPYTSSGGSHGYWQLNPDNSMQLLGLEGEAAIGNSLVFTGFLEVFPRIQRVAGRGCLTGCSIDGAGCTRYTNRTIHYAENDGASPRLLYRTGDALPGTTLRMMDFNLFSNEGRDTVMFGPLGQQHGTVALGYGAWACRGDQLGTWRPILKSGDQLPTPAGMFSVATQANTTLGKTVVTQAGVIALPVALSDGRTGIWVRELPNAQGEMSSIVPAVYPGQTLTNQAGVTISNLYNITPPNTYPGARYHVVDNSSAPIFAMVNLSGAGVTANNDVAIIRSITSASGRQAQLVLREGQSLPGIPQGKILGEPSLDRYAAVNRRGRMALLVNLVDVSTGASDGSKALIAVEDGVPRVVLTRGQVVSSLDGSESYTLTNFGRDVFMNTRGELAFVAWFTGGNSTESRNAVVMVSQTGGASVIAIAGQPVRFTNSTLLLSPYLYRGGWTSQMFALSENSFSDAGLAFTMYSTDANYSGKFAVVHATLDEDEFCAADWNRNGIVNIEDLSGFLAAWFSGTIDPNQSDAPSLYRFIDAWVSGC